MRRGAAVALLVCLLAVACGGAGNQVAVRVDYQHDEFASHYWQFFPGKIYAHPGNEIAFKQEWTGEPHTVTFGTIVDRAIPRITALEKKYERNEPQTTAEIEQSIAEFEAAGGDMPIFDPYLDLGNKSAIQPCYLDGGIPPQGVRIDHTGPRKPGGRCPDRDQPAFNGKQAYYSSGFISPAGPEGNTYRMSLSDDIEPGTYNFYCVIHYPNMRGELVVKSADDELPSQAEVNAEARKEIEVWSKPLRKAFAEAKAGKPKAPNGQVIGLPIGGYHTGEQFHVAVDEFVPETFTAKVNEPITWTITGAHTVSFGVPRYVPIYVMKDDGTIERNPVVDRAAGGSPKPPPVDFSKGPVELDGGTWDGERFISSGLLGSEPVSRYTLRVSKPGRYRYACLIHPEMVATLVVRR